MKIYLTLDYELYGDGSGNVFRNIIEPMDSLLQLAEELEVKYTIFFEFVEYLKLKEQWESGNKMGYTSDPSEAMAEQIRKAFAQGHDIQLHIHPQWINSEYRNNRWYLDKSIWRLGSISQDNLITLFRKGKVTLEKILSSINPNYKCVAVRAGGYNCQPSHEILLAMKQVGLNIDSSIYAGGYEDGLLSKYDFTKISTSLDFWECGDSLESFGKSRVWELPITSYPVLRILKFLSFSRLLAIFNNKTSAVASFKAKTTEKNSLLKRVKYFLSHEYITWDFCLFSQRMNKLFYKKAKTENKMICVLVGHPKGMSSIKSTKKIVEFLKDKSCEFDVIQNLILYN